MADVTMADATADGAKFDLEILATALSARGTNGVKHLDYRRYRQYCARRLRRMRTNKNVNFTHGKSRSYANRRIGAADVTDVRFLMIPLFMAERCWSTAQELHSDWANAEQSVNAKDDDTDIGGGAHLRWRLHAMRRMAKAAYWSHQLKELCSQVADDRTVLEAEAYAATMSGWTHYIRDDHQEALLNLRRAETVYTQLHSLGTTSQQAVYAQQLDTIQPLIKWCQAQQGVVDGGAHATTTPGDLNILADEAIRGKLDQLMQESRKQAGDQTTSISWKGRDVPVRSEGLRLCLVRSQDHLNELAQVASVAADRERSMSVDGTELDAEEKTVESLFRAVCADFDQINNLVKKEEARLGKQMQPGAKLSQVMDELVDVKDYAAWKRECSNIVRDQFILDSLSSRFEQRDQQQASTLSASTDDQVGGKRKSNSGGSGSKVKPPRALDLVRWCNRIIDSYAKVEAMQSTGEDGMQSEDSEGKKMSQLLVAKRALHSAQVFVEQLSWANAVVMYDHAIELANQAIAATATNGGDAASSAARKQRLEHIVAVARGERSVAIASAYLAQLEDDKVAHAEIQSAVGQVSISASGSASASAPATQEMGGSNKRARYLSDRLDDASAPSMNEIFALPPQPEAVPCRPVLLDHAFKAIRMPDLNSRAGKKSPVNRTPKAKAVAKVARTKKVKPAAAPSSAAANTTEEGGDTSPSSASGGWLSSAKGWLSGK